MIKNKQKITTVSPSLSEITYTDALSKRRGRRLSAIEIAEGALLADIGVVFQLLIKYLPVGGTLLQLLVPVIFAVIVLRRGLYVGGMSMGVALFLVCIVLGPGGVPFFLLEVGAGLFLGLTMRHHLSHFLTCVMGVIGGGLGLWAVMLFYSLVSGGPYLLVRAMRQSYVALVPVLGAFFHVINLGSYWQHTLFPLLDRFVQWGLQNWLILFYLVSCLACVPVVVIVYFITNFFLRILGYQVRPFPGDRLEGLFYFLARWFFKLFPRRVLVRVSFLHNLACEVRRLNIARLRRRRFEREAKKLDKPYSID
ncbi:MAG TPA: hypothetical protein VFN35_12300 [Ktedonobacteraceae bacterium]|nr:hypothetical protein [Ktedonobacteraceae bacterium]